MFSKALFTGFRIRKWTAVSILVVACTVITALSLKIPSGKPPQMSSEGIPLPFSAGSSVLRGMISQIGTTTTDVPIEDMTFDNGEISQVFNVHHITFVTTPKDGTTFSSGAALSLALTNQLKFYGYRYTSNDAADEKAMLALKNNPPLDENGNPTAYTYSDMFKGTFFASEVERNDPNSFASTFHNLHTDVIFQPLESVTLDANARYLIIAEELPLRLTVRGLAWCGDGVAQWNEVCGEPSLGTCSADMECQQCACVDPWIPKIEFSSLRTASAWLTFHASSLVPPDAMINVTYETAATKGDTPVQGKGSFYLHDATFRIEALRSGKPMPYFFEIVRDGVTLHRTPTFTLDVPSVGFADTSAPDAVRVTSTTATFGVRLFTDQWGFPFYPTMMIEYRELPDGIIKSISMNGGQRYQAGPGQSVSYSYLKTEQGLIPGTMYDYRFVVMYNYGGSGAPSYQIAESPWRQFGTTGNFTFAFPTLTTGTDTLDAVVAIAPPPTNAVINLVLWDVSTSTTKRTVEMTVGNAGSYTLHLADLVPDTRYGIQIVVNQANSGPLLGRSIIMERSTAPVLRQATADVKGTDVVMSVTSPHLRQSASISLEWRKAGSADAFRNVAMTRNVDLFTLPLDLETATTYEYRMTASDPATSNANLVQTALLQFTTGIQTIAVYPPDVQSATATSVTFKVIGSHLPPTILVNGVSVPSTIEVTVEAIDGSGNPIVQSVVNYQDRMVNYLMITGLQPSTHYKATARAFRGPTQNSEIITSDPKPFDTLSE